ncbi:MAG: hypothetical protein AAF670_02645 [Planctomycetota bacterium]
MPDNWNILASILGTPKPPEPPQKDEDPANSNEADAALSSDSASDAEIHDDGPVEVAEADLKAVDKVETSSQQVDEDPPVDDVLQALTAVAPPPKLPGFGVSPETEVESGLELDRSFGARQKEIEQRDRQLRDGSDDSPARQRDQRKRRGPTEPKRESKSTSGFGAGLPGFVEDETDEVEATAFVNEESLQEPDDVIDDSADHEVSTEVSDRPRGRSSRRRSESSGDERPRRTGRRGQRQKLAGDATFDDVAEPDSSPLEDKSSSESSGETGRGRRRGRRGGRGRSRGRDDARTDDRNGSTSVRRGDSSAVSDDSDSGQFDEEVSLGFTSFDDDPAETESADSSETHGRGEPLDDQGPPAGRRRSRRGGRRRGRGGRGASDDAEQRDGDPGVAADDNPLPQSAFDDDLEDDAEADALRRGGRSRNGSTRSNGEDDREPSSRDRGSGDRRGSRSRRGRSRDTGDSSRRDSVPTWKDVVNVIVDSNLASRSSRGSRGSDGGGSRGGRGRRRS